MELKDFCRKIGLPEKTTWYLLNEFYQPSDFEVSQFYRDPKAFIAQQDKLPDKDAFMLNFFVRTGAEIAHNRYLNKGISSEIYIDTMRDIALWSDVYRNESGRYGLADSEIDWLVPHLSAEIFTLKRLQFKPSALEYDLSLPNGTHFKKDSLAVEIHIPRGGSLDADAIEESLALAKKMFGQSTLYSCYSWLLSPILINLLPPSSNILQFQKLFHIQSAYEDNDSARRYLNYIEATSGSTRLIKAAKELHKSGKEIGAGFGWMVY